MHGDQRQDLGACVMRSKGKQKGSAFERKICKSLSLWISKGAREDLFWRSAMSGGRATVGRKGGKDHARHAGDISATSREGHVLTDRWYVECKSYRDLAICSAMLSGTGLLAKFWRETCKQATDYKKLPMLIAHENQQPTIVLVPTAHLINPYGTAIYPKALIGRFNRMECDILEFDDMMRLPFDSHRKSDANFPFLKPGELERILGPQYKTPAKRKVVRERLPVRRERL
jgi:hypothetical protein